MSFAGIIGHEAAIGLLRRALTSGRLPPALLLHGPEGVGKGTVARALAAALLCERREGGEACGSCTSCFKVRAGSHPDSLIVRRLPEKIKEAGSMSDLPAGEESDLSAFIRIFQIRQLAQHAAHAPREASFRTFIIDPADRMNVESQNALLKTLEEPPGHSVLILVAARPHLLLRTVRSRCLAVGFAPLAAEDLAARLRERGIPEEEALARAALAGGSPGRALTLDLDDLRERRGRMLDLLRALADSPAALADLQRSGAWLAGSDQDALLHNLDLLESLLRDAARACHEAPPGALVHADVATEVADLGSQLGAPRAAELVTAVERLRNELRFNLNAKLLAESLLVAVAGGPVP